MKCRRIKSQFVLLLFFVQVHPSVGLADWSVDCTEESTGHTIKGSSRVWYKGVPPYQQKFANFTIHSSITGKDIEIQTLEADGLYYDSRFYGFYGTTEEARHGSFSCFKYETRVYPIEDKKPAHTDIISNCPELGGDKYKARVFRCAE
jgi:hypothetical protein